MKEEAIASCFVLILPTINLFFRKRTQCHGLELFLTFLEWALPYTGTRCENETHLKKKNVGFIL